MFTFLATAPLGFAIIAIGFAVWAWRAYRTRQYASMIARLMCVGIAGWGAMQMWHIAMAMVAA